MTKCNLVMMGVMFFSLTAQANESIRERDARAAYERWQENGTATFEEKELMEEVLFKEPEGLQDRALDESGEPDGFGYCWVDNQSSDTASFEWIELCGDPLALFGPTGDDDAEPISWSFPFPFYGADNTSAYVSVNGMIAFESSDATWLNRCASFDAQQPEISVHWDDLVAQQLEDCGNGIPRIKYRDFGDFIVIEWKHVWHFPNSGDDQRYSFEAILFANGKIKLQYDTLNCGGYCNSATVGIDVPGSNGVEYVCNGSPEANRLDHGRAVWFYAVPTSPQELVVTAQPPNVLLAWSTVVDADSYYVYRGMTQDIEIAPNNLVAATADTSFADLGILDTPSPSCFYTVTAVRP